VSYATWTPNVGGIAQADSICQSEATTAKLPGTYKALLAPTGSTAASRFYYAAGSQPWIRSDGILVAPTASAFFTTALFDASPNISADGATYYGFSGVWTGAANPLTAGTDATNCANWLSSSGSASASVGAPGDSFTGGYFNEWPINNPCSANWVNLVCLQE
jgi:hypothetical protein